MTSEQIPAEFHDLRAAASFLMRHWREEMRSLFRDMFGHLVRRPEPELVVLVASNYVALGHAEDGRFLELATVPRDGDVTRALTTTLTRFGLLNSDVVLSVPDADVLRPTVRLPSARRNVLAGALGYELEQLTPLDPSELYYDFSLGDRDRGTNTTLIGLRIIRKDIIDTAAGLCRAVGLKVGAIGFENDLREADQGRFP